MGCNLSRPSENRAEPRIGVECRGGQRLSLAKDLERASAARLRRSRLSVAGLLEVGEVAEVIVSMTA